MDSREEDLTDEDSNSLDDVNIDNIDVAEAYFPETNDVDDNENKISSKKRNEYKYTTYEYYSSSESDVEYENDKRKRLNRSGLRKQAFPLPNMDEKSFDLTQEPTNAAQYLAIVRNEAKQLPKIMSKKIDHSKLKKQTFSISKVFNLEHSNNNDNNNNSKNSVNIVPYLPNKEWINNFTIQFKKKRNVVQNLSKKNFRHLNKRSKHSIDSIDLKNCSMLKQDSDKKVNDNDSNNGNKQESIGVTTSLTSSFDIVVPKTSEVSHWIHFMIGILPLHPMSRYKGSEQSKRLKYPMAPLLSILAQLEPIDTESVLRILLRFIMKTHRMLTNKNDNDKFNNGEKKENDENQDENENVVDAETSSSDKIENKMGDDNKNNQQLQQEKEKENSEKAEKADKPDNDINESEVKQDSIKDTSCKDNGASSSRKDNEKYGLTYLSGIWVYALLLRLYDPLSPEIIADVRDFARFCVSVRKNIIKYGNDNEKYMSLLPLLNSFVVIVEHVFNQPLF